MRFTDEFGDSLWISSRTGVFELDAGGDAVSFHNERGPAIAAAILEASDVGVELPRLSDMEYSDEDAGCSERGALWHLRRAALIRERLAARQPSEDDYRIARNAFAGAGGGPDGLRAAVAKLHNRWHNRETA